MGTSKTSAPISPSKPPSNIVRHTTPTIGVALGGGGARGLAHIPMLEAFDELGIRPKVIAGTSIGAIYGAAYASGISGKELRAHTELVLSQRFGLVRDLFAARAQPFQRVMNLFAARSALLDPDALLDLVMPKGLAKDFESLDIPLKIVASDFYDQEPYIFTTGALRPAVAASMALPVIFRPVIHDGKTLIDGGLNQPAALRSAFFRSRHCCCHRCVGRSCARPKARFSDSVRFSLCQRFHIRTLDRQREIEMGATRYPGIQRNQPIPGSRFSEVQ